MYDTFGEAQDVPLPFIRSNVHDLISSYASRGFHDQHPPYLGHNHLGVVFFGLAFLTLTPTSTATSSKLMVSASSFRTLLTLSATAAAITSAEYFQGDGTAYTLSQVSSGNCNLMSANSIAPVNYAALNNEQWNNLGNCGRCAQVSCIDSRCTNPTASAIVQIVDRCPECKYGDLDLSPTVFKTITGSDPSRLKIRWQFVDCPSPGTVKICLKDGSNGYWTAVQPTNNIVGIQSVSINDQVTTELDGAYYFVATSSTGANLNAVNVTVTSVNSDAIRGTYSLTAGQCVDTYQQFPKTSKCNVRRNRN